MQASCKPRPGTELRGDRMNVYVPVHKRNGSNELTVAGHIGTESGVRIYQFEGRRPFSYYGVRCLSFAGQEWRWVENLADRIEMIDKNGLVWVTSVFNAARHGQLRPTRHEPRFIVPAGVFYIYDRYWHVVRTARLS